MPLALHWFLPTNGDSRTDLSLGNAVGAAGSRVTDTGVERAPTLGYIGQIARSAEQMGFEAALTPASSWCEEPWVMTAGLTQLTERFSFLVAFRPGLVSPFLAAQMAATYQRISGGRLLLNLVVGGDEVEQRRFGDLLDKHARYMRAGEFMEIMRRLWTGEVVNYHGEYLFVEDASLPAVTKWPLVYLGGSSAEAIELAATQADVYLTWGEPPSQVDEKLARVSERAEQAGRRVGFGIRLHVIARATSEEAWAHAQHLLDSLDPEAIATSQAIQALSQGSLLAFEKRAFTGRRSDQRPALALVFS